MEADGVIRVALPVRFKWLPGQHVFVRFRAFGLHNLTSHPFTICSLPSSESESEAVLYIRPRAGLTARLCSHVAKNTSTAIPVFLDGPYGGVEPGKFLDSDRLLVVAGGSGAGWMLPLIELFARHATHVRDARVAEEGTLVVRRTASLRVLLATRDVLTRVWFEEAVGQIQAKYAPLQASALMDVEIHLTTGGNAHLRPEVTKNVPKSIVDQDSGSATVRSGKETTNTNDDVSQPSTLIQGFRGRPDLRAVIRDEAAASAVAGHSQNRLGIFLCGPGSMQQDVRAAAAKENARILRNSRLGSLYLHMEHFSWA